MVAPIELTKISTVILRTACDVFPCELTSGNHEYRRFYEAARLFICQGTQTTRS